MTQLGSVAGAAVLPVPDWQRHRKRPLCSGLKLGNSEELGQLWNPIWLPRVWTLLCCSNCYAVRYQLELANYANDSDGGAHHACPTCYWKAFHSEVTSFPAPPPVVSIVAPPGARQQQV